ncbi:TPA: glycosyltransferase [Proteus mirabilis]|uniref:glycosyltransferase family 2 protein n=2 Tax=Proteus mirabilis TaxID=584 RepID=UPI0006689296|nr:glycosyltransferase [Proteus mirabilis]ARA21897.1 hypothetical protein AM438_05140 [Proteus mirabilis]EKV0742264.1 glycosyltransferase [Proteus mirabilis]ELO7514739.1 glycosyltransferase [Proteus mirabilis]MBG2854422.1 glycosyltransferase [Proteus mirabilis]MBG3101379.1 glycosyltransferase [Proteus mirabilis]
MHISTNTSNNLDSLPTEDEIISYWGNKYHTNDIVISICCITYNQEAYIQDALNSFLKQKTAFPFEILIGDDRSTDNTLNILIEYQNKYPNIIRIICPEKNLGANSNLLNLIHHAKAKYIALCEGDDFWIDSHKLEKQYSTMIKYDTNFSYHRAYKLNGNRKRISFSYGENILTTNIKNIFHTHGQYSPTSSYMLKKEVFDILPNWFSNAVIGDFFLEIYSMKDKNGLYLPDIMSVYRENAINSWTRNHSQIDKKINIYKKIIESLLLSKSDFNKEINLLLDEKICHLYFLIVNLYLEKRNFDESKKYITLLRKIHTKFSIKYTIYGTFKNMPYFIIFLIKAKNKLKKLF